MTQPPGWDHGPPQDPSGLPQHGQPPPYGGLSAYPRPPMPPPRRNNSIRLLVVLTVFVVLALAGSIIVVLATHNLTPAAQTGATGPVGSSSAPPTGTASPTNTGSADSSPPSDSAAQAAANNFMSDLKGRLYSQAWLKLCDAGRQKFADGDALRKYFGLDRKSLTNYTITNVAPESYHGDPRKRVLVGVLYSPGRSDTLSLSITLEHDEAAICGF